MISYTYMQHAFYDIPYKSKDFNTVGHEVAGTTTLASPSNEVMCFLPKPLHNSSSHPFENPAGSQPSRPIHTVRG